MVRFVQHQPIAIALAGSAPTARWGHTMEGYDTVRRWIRSR